MACRRPGLNGTRWPKKKPDIPSGDRALAQPTHHGVTQWDTPRWESAGVAPQPGRFIWQLVGVLETYEGNSLTGASVMPVFSGL
ncbi:MAG: hypothetical protein RJB14_1895 [Pseudomonadota bacterium]